MKRWYLWVALLLMLCFGFSTGMDFLAILFYGTIVICGILSVITAIGSFVTCQIRDGIRWSVYAAAIITVFIFLVK